MAITGSYWKAWQLLLIMSAHNPVEFGALGWKLLSCSHSQQLCQRAELARPESSANQKAEQHIDFD